VSTAPSPSTEEYIHPDEARMAAVRRIFSQYLVVEDIYPGIADRFLAHGVTRFAEIGGGRGPVSQLLPGVTTVVVDKDPTMVSECVTPAVEGDLLALPLPDESVDGVAAINCFYFLDDPVAGIREAFRVLKPGGLFVASSPARTNDPELEGIDPRWGAKSTFDSEDAPALVAQVFGDAIEVDAWDLVAYRLPTPDAIADYLHAFNVPDWQTKAPAIAPPMTITKRGAEVWAVKA
jgi:demethylmenaquinone methyltransferase/2-methoxy-6-polyprenyl-1,4-benzoquinol methylase